MKKNNKKSAILLLILLLLVGVSFSYIAGTYAKYTAEINSVQGTATVAKWAFDTENENTTFNVNLTSTNIDATTLVDDKIAPGTEGTFEVLLTNEDSEVGVDWAITIENASDLPTNLKLYADAAHSTVLKTDGTSKVTGQLEAGDADGINVPIYWVWEYETTNGDAADTADGKAAKTLSIGLSIEGVQTEPGIEISSHID